MNGSVYSLLLLLTLLGVARAQDTNSTDTDTTNIPPAEEEANPNGALPFQISTYTLGGGCLALLILVVVLCCRRRRQRQQEETVLTTLTIDADKRQCVQLQRQPSTAATAQV
jgi:hypothetical protein